MKKRRVVITGLGIVSPLGNDVKSNWVAIANGKSGIAPICGFDTTQCSTTFAGQLSDFTATGTMEAKDIRRMDIFIVYGVVAAAQALEDAGISPNPKNAERIAIYMGSGIGGIDTIHNTSATLIGKGYSRISPFFVPSSIINMTAGIISIKYGIKGPSIAVGTACTTGTHSIGLGYRSIAYGEVDMAVTGGSEAPVNPLGLGGFMAARALSTRNANPEKASRPWDKGRDGFVLSEGAGVLLLEEYEHANKRNANIYAEIVGFGMSSDAFHITAPPDDGKGAALAMKNALNDATLGTSDIDYINAHGTSTMLGDLAEVRAVKSIFGATAPRLAISSTKSMTGHLLGAAGAVEAIYTVLAIKEGVAPPTINLDEPDEECDLDFIANTARSLKIDKALSNSFGFGGTNASIIFSRV